MPLKVGLTGGIGTGKTTVAKVFECFGIPVLQADSLAKYLMQHDAILIKALQNEFGKRIYQNGVLQNKMLGEVVFRNKEKLNVLNGLVHPAVIRYGKQWMNDQDTPYAIKEAAIMIESGSYKDLDVIIGVHAPLVLRIQRSIRRDRITEEQVKDRMKNQMDNDEKMKYCKFIIYNDDRSSVIEQCLRVHQALLELSSSQ